jgi:pantoate--beta-alanine ligase
MAPQIITTIAKLREAVRAIRAAGRSLGLVPTMGALHDGHLSLVKRSNERCDVTLVTIFVNPTQFGPNEDLEKYPRTLDADLEALSELQVDIVFAPSNDELYPANFSTFVETAQVAEPLEGECRPGHFRGVITIVMKLFQIATADVAFFGRKDYQQAAVIQAMVRDLNVPIEVEVCPIIREEGGLALSSRNRYLTNDEREQSLAISRSLRMAEQLVCNGERDPTVVQRAIRQEFDTAGIDRIEYIAIANGETLEPAEQIDEGTVALIAAFVGSTRLIDNCLIGQSIAD